MCVCVCKLNFMQINNQLRCGLFNLKLFSIDSVLHFKNLKQKLTGLMTEP